MSTGNAESESIEQSSKRSQTLKILAFALVNRVLPCHPIHPICSWIFQVVGMLILLIFGLIASQLAKSMAKMEGSQCHSMVIEVDIVRATADDLVEI